MTADADAEPNQTLARLQRSERLLATLAPYSKIVLVSHVNPDPDALASMLGLKALLDHCQPGKSVTLTMDGMIARAENRAMAELIPVPLIPVEQVLLDKDTAVVADYVHGAAPTKRKTENIVDIGFRHELTPNLALSVGAGVGVGGDSPNYRFLFAVQKSFQLF